MDDMMDMGSGMDSAQGMMFRPHNQVLAQGYWYIIAFVLGCTAAIQVVEYIQTNIRSVYLFGPIQ